MMNDMKVKPFTFSAIRTCVPFFISMCGLLPNEACIILQVDGLYMGVRNYADLDKYQYTYYRNEVQISFIKFTRK